MTRHLQTFITTTCLCLLVTASSIEAVEKWSRQLESTGPGVADTFDWVPLAQPVDGSSKDRSSNARVLTYSQSFPPNGRFGDQSKAHNPPVSQQQAFDFPYQFQRFAAQPQAQHLRQQVSPFTAPLKQSSNNIQSQEPTSQSFFKFEMPYHGEGGNRAAGGPPTLQTGYQISHGFGGGAQPSLFSSSLYNQQQPVFPPEFHPIPQKSFHQKPLPQQNFIEDSYPIKNSFRESKPQPTQQSLQAVTPQVFPVESQPEQIYELNKPSSFQSQPPYSQGVSASAADPSSPAATIGNQGQQDVQLLYVPYDTLYNQQQKPNPSYEVNKYNVNPGLPAVNPYQINQFYTQDPLAPLEPNYYTTSTTNRPRTTTHKQPTVFQEFGNAQFTTAKPKPKAHQPPLAMFLLQKSARPTQSDIVSTLRNANTIAVIDAPTKQTPNIFVGPSGMPIPEGYVKFDLPYLSQLTQTRDLREVPFFVAPLSYRTPNGFNKILLPEPHVGSIVVNRAKDNVGTTQPPQQNVVYMTPTQNDVSQYQTSTPRPRTSGQRIKQPSSSKDYFPDVLKSQNQFDVTTQRATLQPSRGNKYSYFYDQDAIHEVTSPKITKHDRPKKKRPHNVQIEQTAFTQQPINNPYAQFQPTPNQIINDEYYKIQPNKPSTTSSTSTSTSTSTTSTTSTTAEPPAYFTYSTSPQVEFQSTNGQVYHNFNTATKAPAPAPEEYVPRFTTRPPPVTSAEEEYRMKQYFRQQDAFRNRPHSTSPTSSPYEEVHYTPVSLDYDREVTIPSSTQKSTTPTKQRITYYTPTEQPTAAPEENFNTVPPQEQVYEYNRVQPAQPEFQSNKNLPINHRPSFNQNEIPDSTVEYEPNPYQLPSELPPLTPNLPGLVNNLQDKHNAIENAAATTPTQQESEPPTRPTRRPINRVRKPVVSKITSSVSYSESESTSKRTPQRARRPYGSRGSASSTAPAETENDTTSTTTRRPSSAARNPLIRNPNRIRYQPSNEERNTLRIKPRKQYNGSKKATQSEDLEYQRDVLKQNYPVFKPGGSRTQTSPTAIPSSYAGITNTEGPASEGTQQVYTVTPSSNADNSEQTFPAGLLEPMQIAQQYNKYSKDNYGPGYFPNQEELNPTEPILKNEISPVYTTLSTAAPSTTTTTTEEPQVTTRRSPFIRRNYPRLRTTTEAPTTTTPAIEEKPSVRSRPPPRKVIKVRARTRRPPHPASSTTAPAEEAEQQEPKNNYRKLNRFNQDLSENDTPRRRYKPQFHLDGQESQWSPAVKLSNNNNFKPLNPKDRRTENQHKFENEPEIVTISPDAEDGAKEKNSDTFEVNVSANLGSAETETKTTLKEPNLKPEKSFAELLEEVMGKAPNERPLDTDSSNTKTTDGTYFESQKTTIGSRLNRRGKWKKTAAQAAHNNESFETAESQNIGAQLLNSLYSGGSNNGEQQQKSTEEIIKELRTTTPMTPEAATESLPAITTTTAPPTTMDEYDMTTAKQYEVTTISSTLPMDDENNNKATTVDAQQSDTTEENATRRIDTEDLASADDLETQPSLFSEVRKQLHELFAIEENDDQGVTAALAAVGRRRQEYTNIKRVKTETTIAPTQSATAEMAAATTEPTITDDKKELPKNLMDQVVYATSTSTKVTSETEICYRGRCIRSEDLPSNHKLN